jgi:hypothetical protein
MLAAPASTIAHGGSVPQPDCQGLIRHASFRNLREDKGADEVALEG